MMNILIRADSSSRIGTGHIMRDLVLAKQLQQHYPNAVIRFACMNLQGSIHGRVIDAGYECILLADDTIETLITLISHQQIDFLVIDHYGIDALFEQAIKTAHPKLTLMSVDDTYEAHACDILLNQNVYADKTRYQGLVPAHCELRCGAEYALLRDEFILEKQNPQEKNSIFVGMGGTDPDNVTLEVLHALVNAYPTKINVVTSTANPNLILLENYCATHIQTALHINTPQVAQLMNQAHFAIVSPSVILNELLYLNVPFIAIQIADNQREMVRYLHAHRKPVVTDITTLVPELRHLSAQFATHHPFNEMSQHEAELVLHWRNHPEIRQWMYTTDKITWAQHQQFIATLPNRADKRYYLVKWFNVPVGVIDLNEINHDSCLLGLYADPNAQIRGLGRLLMNQGIAVAFHELQVRVLRLEVFAHNARALRLYVSMGFTHTHEKMVNQQRVLCMELINEHRNI